MEIKCEALNLRWKSIIGLSLKGQMNTVNKTLEKISIANNVVIRSNNTILTIPQIDSGCPLL